MDPKILQSMKRVQIGAKMLFSQIRYRAKPKSKYLFCKKSLILCITTNFGQDKNNFKLFQFSTHPIEELERLDKISINKNLTIWETMDKNSIKISSLNCRSRKHHEDIYSDSLLMKSDIIGLQETWLENDEDIINLAIEKYNLIVNSHGRGKGIATYFNKNIFKPDVAVNDTHMQLSKFTSSILDVIFIYRS